MRRLRRPGIPLSPALPHQGGGGAGFCLALSSAVGGSPGHLVSLLPPFLPSSPILLLMVPSDLWWTDMRHASYILAALILFLVAVDA